MFEVISNPDKNDRTPKKNRKFSVEEKRKLVMEAQATSFNATAQRHGIPSSYLWIWQRDLQEENRTTPNDELLLLIERELNEIAKLDSITDLSIKSLKSDIESKKIGSHSAALAANALTASKVKASGLRLELEKIRTQLLNQQIKPESTGTEQDTDLAEAAQMILSSAVKAGQS